MSESCPIQPPEFKPRIPEAFLQGLSPVEQAMVKGLDVLTQMNEHQTRELAEVKRQTTITNGRVTTLESTMKEHKGVLDRVRSASRTVRWLGGVIVGLLLYFADKVISKMFVFAAAFFLALSGCAHRGAVAAPQHPKPDSAPVVRNIGETGTAITQTRTAVHDAATTAGTAANASVATSQHASDVARAAQSAAENGLAAKSEEAEALAAQTAQLAGEVEGLRTNLFRVTMQLRDAETAAADAEAKNVEAEKQLAAFDQKVTDQTALLNQREVDVANERKAKQDAEDARKLAEGKLTALRLKLIAGMVLLVVAVGASFYFKLLRFGI